MAESAVRWYGLDEFRAELRKIDDDRGWAKELQQVNKKIADRAAEGARGIAVGMGGVWARAADAIGSSASAGAGRVVVNKSGRNPMANVAFWGALRRSGWNAGHGGARQHPPWVGNSWDVATFSGGPYAINRALFFDLPEITADYMAMVDDVARRAFPD